MVETLVPLSATHQGDVGDAVRPHALTRFASVVRAAPATFETSGCTVYSLSAPATAGAARRPTRSSIATGSEKSRSQPSFIVRLHFSLFSSGRSGNGSRRYDNKTPSAAAVSRRPSTSAVFGRQSPSWAAFPGSTQARRTSPGRAGATFTPAGGPSTEVSEDTRSFTL